MSIVDKKEDLDATLRPDGQQKSYLVLSEEERKKGFVRPLRRSYKHVGRPVPKYPLRDLTLEEHERYDQFGYLKYMEYPPGSPEAERGLCGMFFTEKTMVFEKGCGTTTTMGLALCETYACQPRFYGATFCVGCGTHLPVGEDGEFIWTEDGERVGT